jgi:hypothetical protein
MKPKAHTASVSFSVGAPWEIWRTRSSISTGYVVDFYTKSGSDDQYQALLILVPDFNIVVSLLCAGPDAGPAITMAAEVILQTLLPVVDGVAKNQTNHRFGGRYVSPDEHNSSLVLTTDDGPGLLVKEWLSNGVDIKDAAQAYSNATRGGDIRSVRLFPATPTARNDSQVSFRAVFETVPAGYDATLTRVFGNAKQWSQVDQLMYGEIAVDDFTFALDGRGVATAVSPRVLRDTLTKV